MPPDEGGDEGDGRTGGRFLGGLGLGGEPPSAALERVRAHDFFDHAHLETLLEAAELTPVPPPFIHRTALLRQTHVLRALLYSSLEETFTSFTGADSVVLAGGGVAAHGAEL